MQSQSSTPNRSNIIPFPNRNNVRPAATRARTKRATTPTRATRELLTRDQYCVKPALFCRPKVTGRTR